MQRPGLPDIHVEKQSLPPALHLLPAFEAASRLLSFTKAGEELHVTTAAVSHQIKQLESHLDLKLFHRRTRQVALTDAGEAFANVVTQTLSTYRNGHAALMHTFNRPVLRMSMSPFVAYEMLLPKLEAFQAAFPNVDVRLEATMALADFERDGIDAAIRFGSGNWPGLETLLLCNCQAYVLTSPALAKRLPVHTLDDLKNHVLIHPRHSSMDWDVIARLVKAPKIARKGDLVLDSDLAALKAAEQGLGVAFCVLPAGGQWSQSDRLVPLIPPIPLKFKAYFVFKPNSAKVTLLRSAYEWIKGCLLQPASHPSADA